MSALKGFDRIALVLGIIVILPGFVIGYDFHRSEFAKWEKSTKSFDKLEYAPNSKAPNDIFYGRKYVRPPVPISIGVGLVSALASFLIVLYGIRFGTRGSVKLYKWIAEGFKDDSPKDGLVKKRCPYCAEEIQPDAIKCEHCGKWLHDETSLEKKKEDFEKNFSDDGIAEDDSPSADSIDDLNNGQPSDNKIIGSSPKKPSVISNIVFFFLWVAVIAGIYFYALDYKPTTKSPELFYMLIWVGIIIAWTAKRRGKSGWLWFFIGLVIGYCIFLILFAYFSFLEVNKIKSEYQKIEPLIKNVSFQRLQRVTNRLETIENIDTRQNINKAIDIIELANSELSKISAAMYELNIFINKYEDEAKNWEELSFLIRVRDAGGFKYLQIFGEYLEVYKKLLLFSRDNFESIENGKQPETKKYDILFANFESAGNKLNIATFQKDKAMKEYLIEHPEFIDLLKQAQDKLEGIGN